MTGEWPLLETIRFENGTYHRLDAHERRMRESRRALFGCTDPVELERALDAHRPSGPSRFKCRILYGRRIGTVECAAYRVRRIETLRIVPIDSIDYSRKYADRSALEAAKARAGGCDEIIISVDGKLTDTTYSNIALFDGRQWLTPDTPLLAGTMRAWLIESGAIITAPIRVSDVGRFETVSLINAMLDLGEVVVPISAVIE
jgi:4-amino-4-deoxychorismate lyase